jgi:hypothetical protein
LVGAALQGGEVPPFSLGRAGLSAGLRQPLALGGRFDDQLAKIYLAFALAVRTAQADVSSAGSRYGGLFSRLLVC